MLFNPEIKCSVLMVEGRALLLPKAHEGENRSGHNETVVRSQIRNDNAPSGLCVLATANARAVRASTAQPSDQARGRKLEYAAASMRAKRGRTQQNRSWDSSFVCGPFFDDGY